MTKPLTVLDYSRRIERVHRPYRRPSRRVARSRPTGRGGLLLALSLPPHLPRHHRRDRRRHAAPPASAPRRRRAGAGPSRPSPPSRAAPATAASPPSRAPSARATASRPATYRAPGPPGAALARSPTADGDRHVRRQHPRTAAGPPRRPAPRRVLPGNRHLPSNGCSPGPSAANSWVRRRGRSASTTTIPTACPRRLCAPMPASSSAPSVALDGDLRIVEVPGGRHAVLHHRGPYAELNKAYRWLYREWLPKSGEQCADRPIFEEYLNNPRILAARAMADRHLPAAGRALSKTPGNLRRPALFNFGPQSVIWLTFAPSEVHYFCPAPEVFLNIYRKRRLTKFFSHHIEENTHGCDTTGIA